jgi:cell wall assembly regulator SMI1
MWRELVREWHPDLEPLGGHDPGPEFFAGATPEELAEVEQQIGVRLPDSLRDLLAESNGVHVTFGQRLIWSTDEIVRHNLEMHTVSTTTVVVLC